MTVIIEIDHYIDVCSTLAPSNSEAVELSKRPLHYVAPGLFDYFGDDKVALASALIKVASWYGVKLRRAKSL